MLNSSAGKYIVEFAEQYYPKLVLKSDQADSFGRPAHTWLLDNKKIGTYAENVDYLSIGCHQIAYPMVCFCDINIA